MLSNLKTAGEDGKKGIGHKYLEFRDYQIEYIRSNNTLF